MAISSPKTNTHSKNSGKKSKSANAKLSPDVVVVSGGGNPFRNGALTLSRAAWNRCRIFIQLVNGFPKSDERQTVIADLIKDLVLGVRAYGLVWAKLAPDHRHLMVTYVRVLPLVLYLSFYVIHLSDVLFLHVQDVGGCGPGSWRVEAFCSWSCQGAVLQGLSTTRPVEGTPGICKVAAGR